ncbi:MAG: nucleotidyl transferase AbiEii/AbiGii toxin family protein [Treponema sp.]
MNGQYREQVKLLVKCLPVISEENCFALKGGTAINLFYRNLPRLSVDIDLAYIENSPRNEATENINSALKRISEKLNKYNIRNIIQRNGEIEKIICFTDKAKVKIEPNYTNRGFAYPVQKLQTCQKVQEEFGFAEINVLSAPELFGGKICAALDRQHPRDLFDVHFMLENNELNSNIKNGFLIELLSHRRNVTELLQPNQKDMSEIFKTQFKDMTEFNYSYENHVQTFCELVKSVNSFLTDDDKKFLLDFISLNEYIAPTGFPDIKNLSAIQWKLLNLQKLKDTDGRKHRELVLAVENLLYGKC